MATTMMMDAPPATVLTMQARVLAIAQYVNGQLARIEAEEAEARRKRELLQQPPEVVRGGGGRKG